MRPFVWLLICGIALYAADQSYSEGKKLYFSKGCNGCHGINAKGLAAYPGLAYRPKPFLTYKLLRYRNKQADTQQALLMTPFAEHLSDRHIDVLTTFLSQYHEDTSNTTPQRSIKGDGGS